MTQVKKRLSKKTKTSWRKIEHEDVENFLEDQRLEERTGKIADKANDELFVVDTVPAPVKRKKGLLTLREKREKLRNSVPKSFSALINTSKVQDPITKRNRVRTKEERKHFIAKSIEAKNAEQGIVKPKVLKSLADRARSLDEAAARRKARNQADFGKDLWNEQPITAKPENFKHEWIDRKVQTYHLVNRGTAIVSVPTSAHHKRSKLKVIERPHPGTSYNPTFEDHQALLKEVEDRELKIIKREDHLNRVTTTLFRKVTAAERDEAHLKEMSAGVDDDDDDENEANEKDDDPDEYVAVNAPVENKRKDRKARRKQREQLELQKATQQKKQVKKQKADFNRLKQIKGEIKTLEHSLELQRVSKRERDERKREEPHRLSQYTYEEPEIDANMPEDIAGSLRNVLPAGSIMVDRYKSMQRRNIIAQSKDLGLRRRREVKRYVRKTHKEIPQMPAKIKKRKKKSSAAQ